MFDYHFDERKKALLHDHLAHCTISIEAKDGDLPKEVKIPKYCQLPASTQALYDAAERDFRTAYQSKEKQRQKNVFMRMRQLSSGFVSLDADGEKLKSTAAENPKLELLMALVGEISPAHKLIVFHEFNLSGDIMGKALTEAGIRFARIWGGTKDHNAERRHFEKPDCPVLLLANSCGFGLNLQIANYGIFYESPVSALVRKQCERRYIRQHSKAKTKFTIDLIVRDTADERILEFHDEGRSLFDAIIKGRAVTKT